MTRHLNLAEYLWLAEQVTGIDANVLARSSRLNLAESALHAASASFEGMEAGGILIRRLSMTRSA